MPKKVKKSTLKDLKEEINETSSVVAEEIIELEEKAAEKVVEAVENVGEKVEEAAVEVKKDKPWQKVVGSPHFKKFGFASLALIAIGGIGASVYFYNQSTQSQVLGSENQYSKVQGIVGEVGKLMELPNEEPTVATVSDVTKLRDQAFFERAQNGDKVLIYNSSKKAIIYRPSIKKIIDVAVINPGAVQPAAQNPLIEAGEGTTPTPVPLDSTVIILNGTATTGLTRRAEPMLVDIEGIEITDRDNAKRGNYEKSVVVNVNNAPLERVEAIAGQLNATVEELPSDEVKPDADILVILGSDFVE